MFKALEVQSAYHNLLGWQQHYDTGEINLPSSLTNTDTGEYYQQKHPALRLDIIKALIPRNYNLEDYLLDKVNQGIAEMLNDLIQYRHVGQYGKTLLKKTQLLNRYGWLNDKITNESRFVGLQIRLKTGTGLQAVINEIGLQFSTAETFDLYLFHTSKETAIATINVTTTGNGQWDWSTIEMELNAFDIDNLNGGAYIIGYYQDDLEGNAINMTDFNWDRGACGSCNKANYKEWRTVNEYFDVYPIYVPSGSYSVGQMFDLNDAFYINDKSYGLNLRLTTRCDLTDFFIQNKIMFKNLLAYKVTNIILNDMKFSQQINFIEENIKMMIIRDLEGDMETRMDNITTKYQKELKAVDFNISGINQKCLPCAGESYEPSFGVI